MLSTLIWLPVVGAAIVGFLPGNLTARQLRLITLAIASALLFWIICLASQFDTVTIGLQFQEFLPWIETLGLNYQLGIDGLSFPLLALNGLLTWVAIYSSSNSIERPRLYYALILLVNVGIAGAFTAQNLLLFFLFYELELIPLYLLINIWGVTNAATRQRSFSSIQLFLEF